MAKKKTLVNQPTEKSVPDFIAAVSHNQRRADSERIKEVMKEITGEEPKIWGKSIVGFGQYKYKRRDGSEHEWFQVGFSPAKVHLSVYLTLDLEQEQETLQQLGPHKHGRGCLYIKKLEEVDMEVLKGMIRKSIASNS
ncbi:MAG: DUF1801 domain-containing protein [Bacteroidota bacterium]